VYGAQKKGLLKKKTRLKKNIEILKKKKPTTEEKYRMRTLARTSANADKNEFVWR